MKKEIFSISEKHERITIRYRRRRKLPVAICEECENQLELLTVTEAAELTGTDRDKIRSSLKSLRQESINNKRKKH